MSVATLVEHDFQPGVCAPCAQAAGGLDSQTLATHDSTALEARCKRCVCESVDLHMVGLIRSGRLVGDPRGPHGVVAEQQQTFTRLVEPSDGCQPWQSGTSKTAVNSVSTLFVLCRRHEPTRLVQHEYQSLRRRGLLTVDVDSVQATPDRKFAVVHDLPVDPDAPLAHPLCGLRARTEP